MSSEPVIVARNLGKFYPASGPRRMLRYLLPSPVRYTPADFWALREISFEVGPGRVFGVIGRNGGGKSTLLQLISGLLEPSEGSVRLRGRLAALLELGAGFNPEFTGRENVMLSGAIHGYRRREMLERFDEVVAFADIGPHLDSPVKTYSSGMFARLAFAVAIHVNPQVLLVDEILSVGDVGFQAKCFRRIEAMRDQGTTIVFVSHDLNAVQMLCDSALLLDQGRTLAYGEPKDVIDRYVQFLSGLRGGKQDEAAPSTFVRVTEAELRNGRGEPTVHPRTGEPCALRARLEFLQAVAHPVISVQLKTMMGMVVYDQSTAFLGYTLPPVRAGQTIDVECPMTLNICPGPFRIGLGVADVRDGLPVAIGGSEVLAFEAISDRPAFGLADLRADIRITSPEASA